MLLHRDRSAGNSTIIDESAFSLSPSRTAPRNCGAALVMVTTTSLMLSAPDVSKGVSAMSRPFQETDFTSQSA